MMRLTAVSLVAVALMGCAASHPIVVLQTDAGVIEIEVYPDKAPLSAADFLHYVDKGFYDQQGFYRTVRPGNDPRSMGMSLIQGGRLDGESLTDPIAHESTEKNGLSNIEGSISIARGDPGTGSAAFFFINIGDNSFLDHGGSRNPDGEGYAVFGKVVSGMDTVKDIQSGSVKAESDNVATQGQYLKTPVIIQKAHRK